MAIFKAERHPHGTGTSRDLAYFDVCPRLFGYIDQTEGKTFFPLPRDLKFLVQRRFLYFWHGYGNFLKSVRDEGGIIPPEKIREAVNDSYSRARRHLGINEAGLGNRFGKKFQEFSEKGNTMYKLPDFLNKLIEYKQYIEEGIPKIIDVFEFWAVSNYDSDEPRDLILGVETWGELEGEGDIASRPNLIVATKNPNNISHVKLKGGPYTENYMKTYFSLDRSKAVADCLLFKEDSQTFKDAVELFKFPAPENDWSKLELNIELNDELTILNSNMEKKVFYFSESEERMKRIRADFKKYLESKSGEIIIWKKLPHKPETCPGGHPQP